MDLNIVNNNKIIHAVHKIPLEGTQINNSANLHEDSRVHKFIKSENYRT